MLCDHEAQVLATKAKKDSVNNMTLDEVLLLFNTGRNR